MSEIVAPSVFLASVNQSRQSLKNTDLAKKTNKKQLQRQNVCRKHLYLQMTSIQEILAKKLHIRVFAKLFSQIVTALMIHS